MSFLIDKVGTIADWGLTHDIIRFTFRNTSFPPANILPNGWTFEVYDSLGNIDSRWIWYTDIIDETLGSPLKTETLPVLGDDGFYHSSVVTPSTIGKTLVQFSSSTIFEGDKIDVQTIRVDLSSPATVDTVFHVEISDGKCIPGSSIYPNTWIQPLVSDVTVSANESWFEIPILIRGNAFDNVNQRNFDIQVWTEDNTFVYPTGSVLRNPNYQLIDDDLGSGVLKLINGEIVDANYSWSQICATHSNTSFGVEMLNGSFYGTIDIVPSSVGYEEGLAYANYARWTPPEPPEGYTWVEDIPNKVNAGGLNVSNYSYDIEYSVIYPEQDYFYRQNWVLQKLNTTVNLIDESGFNATPSITGTAGADAVIAAGTDNLILTEGADDLVLAGWGTDVVDGGIGDDILYGEGGSDTLLGGEGNDYLYSGAESDSVDAGAGDDIIVGGDGAGNDTYVGGSGIDTIKYTSANAGIKVNLIEGYAYSRVAAESSGIGIDNLSEIENIIAGSFDDLLMGQSADNIFRGMSGADTLDGGAGSDTADYSDKIFSVSVILNGSQWVNVKTGGLVEDQIRNIENLIGGTGNDSLTGDSSNNHLDGGSGNDFMSGGLGGDIYVVDSLSDTVVEYRDSGSDDVEAWISLTLGKNLENLRLLGSDNLQASGNSENNAIRGNLGNNTINGSAGNDWLYGDSGADFFVYDTKLNSSSNVDTIIDFNAGEDKIVLENAIFKKLLALGSLDEKYFSTTGVAVDLDDYLIINTQTGELYYDIDGSGKKAAVVFAVIDLTGLVGQVVASDFLVT